MSNGLRLNHIRNVLSVGEHGSLRAAARALNIAQPALTRSIQDVERLLGVTLFERTSKGIIPTPAGAAFLQRAAIVQGELARACDEAAQLAGLGGGQVHLAMSTAAHLSILPRTLLTFRSRYPDVRLTITEGLLSRVYQQLVDGGIDFYVGPILETELPSELIDEKLFDNERVIFCRRGHPLNQARSLTDLAGAGWIATSVTRDSSAELGPYFEQHGLPAPHIALQASSALTMVLAAAHSDLLAMLPRQWLDFPSIGELLERVPIQARIAAPSIHGVRRRHMPLTPAAQHFYDLTVRAAHNIGRDQA